MATDDDSRMNPFAVVRGILDMPSEAAVAVPTVPPTRRLEPDDCVRVDEEEGLSGAVAAELRPEGARRHSLCEVLFTLGAFTLIVLVCLQILPLRRLFKIKLADARTTFATAVAAEQRDGFPLSVMKSPVEKVLREAESLAEAHRYTEVIALCGRELDALGRDRAKNRAWERVWAVYLETLERTGRRKEMFSRCCRLGRIDPDSDTAAYYRCRHWLGEVGAHDSVEEIDAGLRTVYARILKSAEADCQLRLRGDSLDERACQFALTLGEIRLWRWILGGRRTDADNLKTFSAALAAVRRVPQSAASVKLELRAWEEFRRACRAWHALGWFKLRVCGEDVDGPEVDRRIRELQGRLESGGAE